MKKEDNKKQGQQEQQVSREISPEEMAQVTGGRNIDPPKPKGPKKL